MKITALETIQVEEFGNVVWVRLLTDQGLVGLGETFRNPQATIAYLHETCAPYLLGKDPLQIERHHFALMNRVGSHFNGFPTRSVELRGNSAVDIALWDLLGQALNAPIHQLLGGLARDKIAIYNTCAGYAYNSVARAGANTQSARELARDARRPYEDLEAQLNRPGELAQSLLDEGIAAMKIWPFDAAALASDGQHIDAADLKAGVGIVEAIRRAVGGRMEILLEFHGLWQLAPAQRIAAALGPYDIYWYEDPISLQNFDDLAAYKRGVKGRVAGSEALGTPAWYRETFTRCAIDVANFDMGWIGGLTAGRRVAALAQAFDRPIAPHDCTGPVVLAANIHLMMASANALLAETVRAHLHGFYRDAVTVVPRIERGFAYPLAGPGLGTALAPGLTERPDARVRRTAA
jgi:L-alanine-DL-glutamate epimerase-like enolase superfamily enzyme